ncbi:MAG: mechanosensitive ion channel family protein [Flavobacteriales bacterium]|nr:mechanosensitive ion channel family protein [Flavobacteriales bacterium]MCB9364654.1 mechanosensitive ion channel family protein [Flavobacteriales bacterium]
MKEFLAKEFYHNTVGDWALTFLIILGAVIVGKVVYWFFGKIVKKITSKTKTKIDDIIVDMIEEPIVLAITIFGLWYGLHRLEFTEWWYNWLGKVYHILIAINITWLIARLVDAVIEEYIVPLTEKTESDLDDQVMPIVRKGLRSMIWILGVIVALNNAGYDVGALIAGLGIGGLALAMAAKDSVSNIFGGIMIFTDKPFKVGDRIKIGGFDGTIEEIGIRISRMRTLEGRLVTIPNSQFIGNMVENVSAEPTRKVVSNIGLIYDTSPEQIELGIKLLNDIAFSSTNVEDNYLTSFNAFGDFSLGILFIYYIKKESDIFQTQTEINLEILKRFNANGLEMAFPTQTIYTKS